MIRVTTNRVTVGQDRAITKGLAKGDYLEMQVSDTGSGMSAETQATLWAYGIPGRSEIRAGGAGLAHLLPLRANQTVILLVEDETLIRTVVRIVRLLYPDRC
jgi:hypothetical protein